MRRSFLAPRSLHPHDRARHVPANSFLRLLGIPAIIRSRNIPNVANWPRLFVGSGTEWPAAGCSSVVVTDPALMKPHAGPFFFLGDGRASPVGFMGMSTDEALATQTPHPANGQLAYWMANSKKRLAAYRCAGRYPFIAMISPELPLPAPSHDDGVAGRSFVARRLRELRKTNRN
jgi:hypothetical protein